MGRTGGTLRSETPRSAIFSLRFLFVSMAMLALTIALALAGRQRAFDIVAWKAAHAGISRIILESAGELAAVQIGTAVAFALPPPVTWIAVSIHCIRNKAHPGVLATAAYLVVPVVALAASIVVPVLLLGRLDTNGVVPSASVGGLGVGRTEVQIELACAIPVWLFAIVRARRGTAKLTA